MLKACRVERMAQFYREEMRSKCVYFSVLTGNMPDGNNFISENKRGKNSKIMFIEKLGA